MEKYGVNELRNMFLDYFEKKNGHLRMKSFSLVPQNDNSVLIINAGMTPLKPYFTGQEIPPRRRVCTCQKCIRTGDIENVGKTARHGTFFEMLGNFSFGDYFKKEAIHWSWEFLTDVVGLDPDRLYPSVSVEDDEAFDIWNKQEGIPADRIYRFGKEDNFWEHGSGPCGPCSEIYYDRGEKYGCGKPTCTVGCDCDRYIEIWNNVFTQFNNDGKGNYTVLDQKNIDTGMGLERLAVVVQDVDSIFDVDTLAALTAHVGEISGVKYKTDPKADISIRIITDHIRSVTFMISDGIMPSNNGRGYVLRRLLRRAARHGRLLGVQGTFLAGLADTVIDTSCGGYPELLEKRAMILAVITEEENKFNKTIDTGLSLLHDEIEELKKNGGSVLSGQDAFRLYDTYGFPRDLTEEILAEQGLSLDEQGFDEAMEAQRTAARTSRRKSNYMGKDATAYDEIDAAITTEFVGYTDAENTSEISVLVQKSLEDEKDYGALVDTLEENETGAVIVPETAFYATMGGQEGDFGVIENAHGLFRVKEAVKLQGGKVAHIGVMESGSLTVGDLVRLVPDPENRRKTCANHTATHLLQKALRDVLGTHVEQAGSLNNASRLRFDFTHFQAMTPEEIRKVEAIVNEKISEAVPVVTEEMDIESARKKGAMALFGEKYGDRVRVVSVGDFSIELCGGTHVKNTSDIRVFKILSESGIAAGVRRIEAITADNVLTYYREMEERFEEAASVLKTSPAALPERLRALQNELKALQSENEKLKADAAKNAAGDVLSNVKDINGIPFLGAALENVDANELRNLSDGFRDKLGECVILLISTKDGKVSLVAAATDSAVKRGAHAGNLIKAVAGLVGGGGGGRPNMAQAGGKDPSGIPSALAKAEEVLKADIK
ncbi:MAG: alanine--tRNA ligase [Lachnospiraceae bacterium]|nr:alanine--tRNA ligase [Lachnospiraceae bacterium]